MPKALDVKLALVGSDDDRFGSMSCDSDVYDSDTGAGTPRPAAPPTAAAATGEPCAELSELFYEPHDLAFEPDEDAAAAAAESLEMALTAGLTAIHAPYPPAEVLVPNTPDSVLAAAPPPLLSPSPSAPAPPPPPGRSSSLHNCSSFGHLRSAESWASIELSLSEAPPQLLPLSSAPQQITPSPLPESEPPCGLIPMELSLEVANHKDGLHREQLRSPLDSSFVFQPQPQPRPACGAGASASAIFGPDAVQEGAPRSTEWLLLATHASSVGSADGCVSVSSADGCVSGRSSQMGATSASDRSSLYLPGPEASSEGTDVHVTVTMGNPLFMKTSPGGGGSGGGGGGGGGSGGRSSVDSDGARAEEEISGVGAGRARRRLPFFETTLVDNPCFAASVTTVNNPCFGRHEWQGAVLALMPYRGMATPAAAAASSGLTAVAAGAAAAATSAHWHPSNPLAEEASPSFHICQQQPCQQQLGGQRSQPQKQLLQPPQSPQHGAPLMMAGVVKAEAAEADHPPPPVTPAKSAPPPLAAVAPDSPSLQPSAPLTGLQPLEPPPSFGAATAPMPSNAVATCVSPGSAIVATAVDAGIPGAVQSLPPCSVRESMALGDPSNAVADLEMPPHQQQQQQLEQRSRCSDAGSQAVVEGPRVGPEGPAPRAGPCPVARPPWRPTACPHRVSGSRVLPEAGAAAYRRGSAQSGFLYSILASENDSAASQRQQQQQQQRASGAVAQSMAGPLRPPFRPPSKYANGGGLQSQAGAAASGGALIYGSSSRRTSTEWAPGMPSFMRPTQAFLSGAAAAVAASSNGSVADSRFGSGRKEARGRHGESQRTIADSRPRWR